MTNRLKKFHSVQTSSPEEMVCLRIEVIVENMLNTYNEQIQQIHRAIISPLLQGLSSFTLS